ncbi:TPA: hypothetical protein N0F65_012975 [Lagenidium giganteum]|uniref:Transposase n=1 Tax=Lagenidium giganteum TaxID=4803 RepID=A0AAV2Z309_9STRA|nr:TPA: hypothetical protein N0F65_012975 [Lagenidium giganteum]
MGEPFGIILDGWPNGTFHFLGVFAVYWHANRRQQRLLSLSTIETGRTADVHRAHLEAVLSVYDKRVEIVKFLVGDNCSTNQALATKLGIPLVGCASHRFNLVAQDIVDQVRPVLSNATRWSSTFAMLYRYRTIRTHLIGIAAVEDVLLHGSSHRQRLELYRTLKALDSVCQKLRAESAS